MSSKSPKNSRKSRRNFSRYSVVIFKTEVPLLRQLFEIRCTISRLRFIEPQSETDKNSRNPRNAQRPIKRRQKKISYNEFVKRDCKGEISWRVQSRERSFNVSQRHLNFYNFRERKYALPLAARC